MESTRFRDAVALLEGSVSTRVVVVRPRRAAADPVFADFYQALADSNTTILVDTVFLQSLHAMRHLTDILVIPELDSLDVDDYRHVIEYVQAGGALLAAANDMFAEARNLASTRTAGHAAREDTLGYYRHTKAHLGIKPHRSDIAPTKARTDPDFITCNGEIDARRLGITSIRLNTTSSKNNPQEQWGTQFVQRMEVTTNFPVVTGYDPNDLYLTTAVNFSQNWETGSRLCIFNGSGDGTLLDAAEEFRTPLLQSAVRFLQNKIMLSSCQTNYACYRQGETVKTTYSMKNFHDQAVDVRATLVVRDDTGQCYRQVSSHLVPGSEEVQASFDWKPQTFASDYYTVEVKLSCGKAVVSKRSNGFVVWQADIARTGPSFETDGAFFKLNGKNTWINGTNYYESNQGSQMWVKPNIARLHDDLKQMSQFGLTFMRVHYHHPKWFHDHYQHAEGFVPEEYVELGQSYLPAEHHLRIFDAHIYLCQKYGLVYGGDLFTLRPNEMGDARGWFGVRATCGLSLLSKHRSSF